MRAARVPPPRARIQSALARGWEALVAGVDPPSPARAACARRRHLHLISTDLDSDSLKNKKHWNSFATRFLIPPDALVAQLEGPEGRLVTRGHAAEEASLKEEMRCPVSGEALRNMPAVKARVGSAAYRQGVRALAQGADVVERWPAW